MVSNQDIYNNLAYYTLAHPDPSFIHQHVVDAFTAQVADENTKPIAIAFALIGLYLYLEKNFNGKQVQQAHMRLARKRKSWPKLVLPTERGLTTASDVLSSPPGKQRDEMIRTWCSSVWESFKDNRDDIKRLVLKELNIK